MQNVGQAGSRSQWWAPLRSATVAAHGWGVIEANLLRHIQALRNDSIFNAGLQTRQISGNQMHQQRDDRQRILAVLTPLSPCSILREGDGWRLPLPEAGTKALSSVKVGIGVLGDVTEPTEKYWALRHAIQAP